MYAQSWPRGCSFMYQMKLPFVESNEYTRMKFHSMIGRVSLSGDIRVGRPCRALWLCGEHVRQCGVGNFSMWTSKVVTTAQGLCALGVGTPRVIRQVMLIMIGLTKGTLGNFYHQTQKQGLSFFKNKFKSEGTTVGRPLGMKRPAK